MDDNKFFPKNGKPITVDKASLMEKHFEYQEKTRAYRISLVQVLSLWAATIACVMFGIDLLLHNLLKTYAVYVPPIAMTAAIAGIILVFIGGILWVFTFIRTLDLLTDRKNILNLRKELWGNRSFSTDSVEKRFIDEKILEKEKKN